ncbi:glycoside hydrolase family 3 C-terminal domain-containing protein [Marinagarivorans cellulosilyticus]|uniref:Beta-glucosidase n=1 Tax=Marinagarivorans cellulosilyticus TaxID=2721545 RepID=A0AAN1WGY4_9GAMM|nr:glycoside hydrolase family 3 C-terminal domain-containing protein [Marinagarivorans cellulosilyticus]BCD97379.1 beta-glucosidase [Marinagarivorans cellulosilyticus]
MINPTLNKVAKTLCLGASITLASCSQLADNKPSQPDYLNTALSTQERAEDLVARMTLSEKIAQLYNEAPAIERLGVAEYNWWNEALHGVARAGKATVYPQAIGLAATFNKELMGDIATSISDEARAKHHYYEDNDVVFRYTGLTFWSPNVNIFRDPRWGRGQETYGEDPYLTGSLAIEFIKGLQGDNKRYLKTSAMAKHFAVHSGPEKSRHSDNYAASLKDMHETYLPAFKMAVEDANVESIMCAYNRVNDDPACGSEYLLKDVLRGDWGFDGHVVSDCGALDDFYAESAHNIVKAPAQAAALALKTGTDLDCGTSRLSTFTNLHFALQRGLVSQAQVDNAVINLFKTRFKLGMFDPKSDVPYANIAMTEVGSAKHQQLALEAAQQSLVLLKNDGILPLKPNTKVAVIGPNATNPSVLVGNYHGDPIAPVLPLEGIRQKAGENNVTYAAGSPIIGDIYGSHTLVPSSVLFHRASEGKLKPGLQAAYYEATQEKGMASTPAFKRIDSTIDFHWLRSPIDNSVWDEFGIVWEGILKPEETGHYQFDSTASIQIDGKAVTGSIELKAKQEYRFQADVTFLRTWWGNNPLEPYVKLRWVNTSEDFTAKAIAAANKADVIIFTGGISALLEGEEMAVELEGFDYGDRTTIELPKEQLTLMQRLKKLGKPIVMVNFSGSAMALNWQHENLNAIVQAFYPGEATGTALANILWGDVSPSGRLPVTFYKGVNDLPDFKDYRMDNRTYKYYNGTPLYPFGHGLSYADFEYHQLQAPSQLSHTQDLEFRVALKNNGAIPAMEITQVYIAMPDAPVKTPKVALVAYEKNTLDSQGTLTLEFKIPAEKLRYVDEEGKHQPYTGRLKVSVGSGQPSFVSTKQKAETTINIH